MPWGRRGEPHQVQLGRGIPCQVQPGGTLPEGGYPARGIPCRGVPCQGVPCRGAYPARGYPCQVTPPARSGWRVPCWGGTLPGGYPGQVTPLARSGRRGYPAGGGTQVGQQKEYSIHGGRYASCVHAGGLSCWEKFLNCRDKYTGR